MSRNILILLFSLLLPLQLLAKDNIIKVACIGNSVTYGARLSNREVEAYPSRLQSLLGGGYDVRNFGHSGATLLRRGHRPYNTLPEFRQALDFKPDWVVIHLGLNDTDPRDWPHHADDFIADYRALIDSFRTANPEARVWICLMTPIFPQHPRFESGTRLWHSMIQQRIRQIARTANVGLIDLYTPLHRHPDLFPDALHPNAAGAMILARTVYSGITGNYGGLRLSPLFSDGMVLQRDTAVCISGRANAGDVVKLEMGSEKYKAVAASDGRWSLHLKPHKAGGPYTMTIKAGGESKVINDVWFGEVWLCSGQSNMEFSLAKSRGGRDTLKHSAEYADNISAFCFKPIAYTDNVQWGQNILDSINNLRYFTPCGWQSGKTEAYAGMSAVGFYFAKAISDSLKCRVGVICNAVGGSGIESWIDRSTLEENLPAALRDWRRNDYIMKWSQGRANRNTALSKQPAQRHPYEPAYLYECGIEPLLGTTIKGVIWYQGESNADKTELHEDYFKLWLKSWRNAFGSNLPVYFVQLSSIATRPSWPHFRDSQRRLAKALPNVWMAVSSDLGDSLDVHPKRKREVGQRLALQALRHTYGNASIVASGPEYKGFVAKGRKLVLSFDNAEGLCSSDGKALRGFEVAGEDGLFHEAQAKVKGSTVQVWSDAVGSPRAVRYGWQPFTRANLANATGLPASTFIDEEY